MTTTQLSKPPVQTTTQYAIKGFYFGDDKETITDTHYHYNGADSLIDHQRAWYNEAINSGYVGGELDEAETIKANYDGELTEELLIAITNDGTLMDTPLHQLFPHAISQYVVQQLQLEYEELCAEVNNAPRAALTDEYERLDKLQQQMQSHARHHA